MRLTQEQFVERLGDPAKFSHRGQCYDSRIPNVTCICDRKIRFCFIVYSGTGQKMVIGSCCFKYFAKTRLAEILEASQVFLLNVVVETQKAEKRAADQLLFQNTRKNWNKARREAIKRIREHREATGKKWLPEPLFDIKTLLATPEPTYRHSTKAAKWFEAKAEYLRKKLAEAEPVSGIIGHEATADNPS